MLDLWLLVVFGFFIGILASMTGVGGGVFIVPILTLLYNFLPANAVGTSLTTIIFTAMASAINYAMQKRIYYKTGIVLIITTAPGAYLGAWLTTIIKPRELGLIFGVFLIFVALRMAYGLVRKKGQGKTSTVNSDSELLKCKKTIVIGAGLSFFGGLASGLLGIGGGTLVVPIMTITMGMPIHYATATSMFTMIFTSISGVAQHYQANHIDFAVALLFAAGTIIGAQVGAYTSKRISGRNLSLIFAIMLTVAGINMIVKYM